MKMINKTKISLWFIGSLIYVLLVILAAYYTLDFIIFG